MPKNSGEDMKTTRLPPARPLPKPRPIMHQTLPSGPKVRPSAMGAPKIAADLAPNPSSINPKQMVY
jgi:hypothetical protein